MKTESIETLTYFAVGSAAGRCFTGTGDVVKLRKQGLKPKMEMVGE